MAKSSSARSKTIPPLPWQIFALPLSSGELYIDDLQTPSGLVLDFQHSAIKPGERRSRKAVYGKMLWIADGSRLTRDHLRVDTEVCGWRQRREGTSMLLR